MLAAGLRSVGAKVGPDPFFDTLTVSNVAPDRVHAAAEAKGFNLRRIDASRVGISLDEATTLDELKALLGIFGSLPLPASDSVSPDFAAPLARTSPFLTAAVFQRHHTEHEMLRYIKRLEAKDLTLCQSMISLGSCTMKLNAASELFPVSWPEFSRLHPFAPEEQTRGYRRLFRDLEAWLAEITGFAAVSLQPNAGSQGSTRACSSSAPTMNPGERDAGTCASYPRAPTGQIRRARRCAATRSCPCCAIRRETSTSRT